MTFKDGRLFTIVSEDNFKRVVTITVDGNTGTQYIYSMEHLEKISDYKAPEPPPPEVDWGYLYFGA